MTKIITELVEFTALDNKSDNDIIEMTEKMAGFFMNDCEGCIDFELVKGDEKKWISILHWESKEKFDKAGKKMNESTIPKLFAQYLVLESIKLIITNQMKVIK